MNLNELRLVLAGTIRGSDFAGRTYFAGGCVRDMILEREVSKLDADIAVELPNGGVRLARFLHQVLPTSEPEIHTGFGTANSVYRDVQLDFVMTRCEAYAPGSRHPRVQFADLQTDCQRRDFTVNALYQELLSGKVLDPSGKGLNDLQNKIIQTVIDPASSFQEDPLRMLRALRFAVVLRFEIEQNTYVAILANAQLVSTLSRQRCRNELQRLEENTDLVGRERWLSLLEDTGIKRYLESKLTLS